MVSAVLLDVSTQDITLHLPPFWRDLGVICCCICCFRHKKQNWFLREIHATVPVSGWWRQSVYRVDSWETKSSLIYRRSIFTGLQNWSVDFYSNRLVNVTYLTHNNNTADTSLVWIVTTMLMCSPSFSCVTTTHFVLPCRKPLCPTCQWRETYGLNAYKFIDDESRVIKTHLQFIDSILGFLTMIIENVEALKSWLAKLLEPMWVLNWMTFSFACMLRSYVS